MDSFTPATRRSAKARVALSGPSGSGKTYTALAFATRLGDRIAVVDTERGSASTYAGMNGWSFDTVTPDSFDPSALIPLLAEAGAAGYDVVVVDSLSHYWMGIDGMLEQVDRRTKGSSSFSSGWKDMRPVERRMIDALVAYPGHVIVTLRVKTEYVVEKDDRGKSVPRKVGLKPEQREGLEYEFGVVGDLDLNNVLTITKSRVPALSGRIVERPDGDLAEEIRAWYEAGEDTPDALELRAQALADGATLDELQALGDEVRRLGLAQAAVTDEHGAACSLLELVRARWQVVKLRADATNDPRKDAK